MMAAAITITEPGSVEIKVTRAAAARAIRAWFCTSGAPLSAVETLRAAGLRGTYRHVPAATVRYRDVPAIEAGETLGDYAERVADFVNDKLGREYDEQLYLSADDCL